MGRGVQSFRLSTPVSVQSFVSIHLLFKSKKLIALSMPKMLIPVSWESAMSLQQVVLPTPTRGMLFSLCGSMPLLVWVNPFSGTKSTLMICPWKLVEYNNRKWLMVFLFPSTSSMVHLCIWLRDRMAYCTSWFTTLIPLSQMASLLWIVTTMFCDYASHGYGPMLSRWLLQRLHNMHACLLTPCSGSITSLLIQLWMLWSMMSWFTWMLHGWMLQLLIVGWQTITTWLSLCSALNTSLLSLWLSLAIQAAALPKVLLAFVAMGSLILALILSVSMVWIQLPLLTIPFQCAWVVHCLTIQGMQLPSVLQLNLLLVSHLLSWSKWVSDPMRNNPSLWCWCASLSYWPCVRELSSRTMEDWLPIHSISKVWMQVCKFGTILHQLLHLLLILLWHLPIPLLIMQQWEPVILCQAWVLQHGSLQQCKFMKSPKTLVMPWLWTQMVYQRLVWILLVLTVWSFPWILREKHVLSLPLQTKSHFWSMKICAMMFVKHFQVLPPSLIPLRVP